jgi:hypothetical protein
MMHQKPNTDPVPFLNLHPVTNPDPFSNPKLEKDPEKIQK